MKSVLEINANDWEKEVINSNILTVVDFWHENCPWCISLNPILEELAEEYKGKIKFTKLNVLKSSDNRKIAISYGVMGTPTLIFFCAGRPVESIVGFMPKEDLKEVLENMLKKHRECIKKALN